MITRALESLAAQTHPSIAITIVQFHPVEGLDDLLAQYSDRFAWINRVIVPNLGNRATCWWAGLHAVRADYLAFLDDDDTLFPNHVALLLEALERHPESGFAYCGLIRIEEEEGHYVDGPQFNGPRGETIPEQRELFAIEEERFVDFSPTRNVIGHNAWICRRSVLDEDMLRDPAIDWAEDVFFLTLAAGRTPFRFVPGATATWHWRSTSKDNWTLSHPSGKFRHNYARWRRRLQATRIPAYSRIAPPAQEMQVDEMHARDIG
nr:glycosyltransferase family 2 protein [Neoroseomonas alba]